MGLPEVFLCSFSQLGRKSMKNALERVWQSLVSGEEGDVEEVREEDRVEGSVKEESQGHLSACPHYAHLRTGLDITTTEGMVTYFQLVLKERDKK